MLLNLRSSKKKPILRKLRLLFLIVVLISVLVLEMFREILREISLFFIQKLQESSGILIEISVYISYLGSTEIFLIYFLILHNFVNILKSFVLIMIIMLSTFISIFFQLVYSDPRPYYIDKNIKSYNCLIGYGNPSGNLVVSMAVYMTLCEILCNSNTLKKRKWQKITLLFFSLILILALMILELFTGSHFLDQILFGTCLGFMIYFLFFHCFDLDLHLPKFFILFIQIKSIYFILFNTVIIGVYILFMIELPKSDHSGWIFNIKQLCEEKLQNISEDSLFKNEAYILFGISLSNIGAIIGIKSELYFSFNGNLPDWISYNFSLQIIEDNSCDSSLILTQDNQWNHTNFTKSILRLIVTLIIVALLAIPSFFLKENDVYFAFFFKIFLPLTFILFFQFYIGKILFRKLRLSNNSIFLIDSF